jgi:NADPH:quinone reductase-like Zn-dependent oxidoreductase
MKAIVQDTYGSPDVLNLREIDTPEVGDDEALVRVHAAGVERGVWYLITGLPYLARLAFGLLAPKTSIPGYVRAGVVEAVGKDVSTFQPGDEVFGIGKGTVAEYARSRRQARAQTGEPQRRAGGGGRHLRLDGKARCQGDGRSPELISTADVLLTYC